MTIPIEKEEDVWENWPKERCEFCGNQTDTWHVRTNNPVCKSCSKIHKVSELTNHRKPKK